jgi:hypothetical protein
VTVVTRLGHFAMLFGKDGSRCHVRVRGLQLILPTAYDIAIPAHHPSKPAFARRPDRLSWIAHLRIEHVGPLEDVRLGRTSSLKSI